MVDLLKNIRMNKSMFSNWKKNLRESKNMNNFLKNKNKKNIEIVDVRQDHHS
jgi:hypothetical protein